MPGKQGGSVFLQASQGRLEPLGDRERSGESLGRDQGGCHFYETPFWTRDRDPEEDDVALVNPPQAKTT